MGDSREVSRFQTIVMVGLRLVVGWHFLYEGVSKLLTPGWTSAPFLENSRWLFSGLFRWIASSPVLLGIADSVTVWGLIIIGLCILLGLWTRVASVAGAGLVGLFYLANPPLIQSSFGFPVEGNYLFVDKNLVEIFALLTIAAFPTDTYLGFGVLLDWIRERFRTREPAFEEPLPQEVTSFPRRELVRSLALVPFLGAFVYGTNRKHEWEKVHSITGASIQLSDSKLKDLKGELPKGSIGGFEISRLIMGGNLIGGWSHSRDLIYVSSLFKAYNTEEKIFQTFDLAEKAGINTINITVSQFPVINKYKEIFNSRLQTISQVHPTREKPFDDINMAIDAGVDLIQIQGNCCDWRVRAGELEVLDTAISYIRKQGFPAGLGAHSVQALMACAEAGIEPDFYMKTLHHDHYWSAHPRENRIPFSVDGEKSRDHNEFHDNMFCLFPERTVEFMQNTRIPFIAFKILAGGAIHPNEGFSFAFENGADFICVGMFDYQVVDDVNIALDVLSGLQNRQRYWCA